MHPINNRQLILFLLSKMRSYLVHEITSEYFDMAETVFIYNLR